MRDQPSIGSSQSVGVLRGTGTRTSRCNGRGSAPTNRSTAIARDPILTTRVGLRIPPGLTFDDWEQAGQHIARVIDSSAWCLGDWLVYGQDQYNDRYRRAVDVAGLDYQTLRNYAWVTRRFELSRRRARLSLQHHAEVASLPVAEQDHWLDQAEQHGWSRNQLRRAVRGDGQRQPADTDSGSALLPRVMVRADRMNSWRTAAEMAQIDLTQWVIETLDRAAAHALVHGPLR
jgi:hypothetical protein